MGSRFFVSVAIVIGALGVLIYTAVDSSARSVVTVEELALSGKSTAPVRLGARVAGSEIEFHTQPEFLVSFFVRDPGAKSADAKTIPVVYRGVMPDTLKVDRDVILEGSFDGQKFHASSLLTQCPSKYEPPVPGSAEAKGPDVSYQ